MAFNDDEQIVLPPGEKPIDPGRVKLEIRNNDKVPIDDHTQKVMFMFTGEEKSRSPVDIVAVLDVSGSMNGQILEELKRAMLFVMNKLSSVDRLSIVVYSNFASRLCPLRQITDYSKTELENLIIGCRAGGGTNMEDGLCLGLSILKDRTCSRGRVGTIIFMTDGIEAPGSNVSKVEVDNVTVHTFGFGSDHDAMVLKAIADKRRGGTYSDFSLGNLSLGFAQCLGGLLSVVAQDLTLVLHLSDEEACNYSSQVWNQSTTRLGDLCIKECRKVLMEVHLPRGLTDILKVSYTYKFDGEIYESDTLTISVHRTVEVMAEQQQALPEVRAEDIRLRIVRIMKQATADADKHDLESARDKLVRGIKSPTGFSKDEVGVTSSSKQKEDVGALWAQLNGELKYDLRAQLEELLELMESVPLYEKEGRPFAYSLLSSHDAQRPAGRGYNMEKFATPQMCDFLLEAAGLNVKS